MKHSTRYNGNNPIPDAKRGQRGKVAPAPVEAAPAVVGDKATLPDENARGAELAAVAISRVEAMPACAGDADADPNVTIKPAMTAKAAADPLASVPSGAQILADTGKMAAAKRATS